MTETKPRTVHQILNDTLTPTNAIDPTIWKFILAYLETRHVGDAAKSVKLTAAQGKRILAMADVQLAVREIAESQARVNAFDLSEILERANEIAQVDLTDLFTPDGAIKPIDQIPSAALRAVKKMTVEEVYDRDDNGIPSDKATGRIIKIDFWDRLKAVELLGKHEGGFKDTLVHEHTVSKSLADVVLAEAERRALAIENKAKLELNIPNVIDVEVIDE